MKVKEFAGMQMTFADNPLKFDVCMSTSVSGKAEPLTISNYNELGELTVDNWEVIDGRMRLYCSID